MLMENMDNAEESSRVRKPVLGKLPLGSVRPQGWLLKQLEMQRDGLTGHAEELYPDIGKSDWLTGKTEGGDYAWERGPYYAKGLVALALTLDDSELKGKAHRWVDAILASQRDNGDFGTKCDNWWPNMIVLHMLRDWCEATGDERVVDFMFRYFDYQAKRLPEHSLYQDSAWATARGGDEVEVVLWLYDRTHKASLVDLAELLLAQSSDWTSFYAFGGDGEWGPNGYRHHIVNFMQGLKLPALKWRVHGSDDDRLAYRRCFDPDGWAMRMHGRVDRMVNGSEPLSGRSASEGTELCAVAERILSCQEVMAATGDLQAADDLEIVAYNTLPGILGDDGRGLRYYSLLNQPVCETRRNLGYENNQEGASYTPGPDSGYGCCRSNFHFAWPKFVQSMWMKKDDGLAAMAFGPSVLTTRLGNGEVSIRMITDYPFGDTVTFRIEKGEGSFPIFVRIPGWDASCDAGSFRRYEKDWKPGDEFSVTFAPEIVAEHGINDSVALKRGALVYSLKIEAEVKTIAAEENRSGFPIREYAPKGQWNYALVIPKDGPIAEYIPPSGLDGNVFEHGRVPCAIKLKGFKTGYGCWGRMMSGGHFSARAGEPPPSPLPRSSRDGQEEMLTLVPMGATQIRITLFPWAW